MTPYNCTETHRSSISTSRDGEFDTFLCLKTVDTPRRKKIRRLLRTAQDLEQYRDGGWLERDAIDSELCVRGVLAWYFRGFISLGRKGVYLLHVQIDIDVSAAGDGFTWLDHHFVQ
jgi:hypothetical protein